MLGRITHPGWLRCVRKLPCLARLDCLKRAERWYTMSDAVVSKTDYSASVQVAIMFVMNLMFRVYEQERDTGMQPMPYLEAPTWRGLWFQKHTCGPIEFFSDGSEIQGYPCDLVRREITFFMWDQPVAILTVQGVRDRTSTPRSWTPWKVVFVRYRLDCRDKEWIGHDVEHCVGYWTVSPKNGAQD
jgi:hypothetical protein